MAENFYWNIPILQIFFFWFYKNQLFIHDLTVLNVFVIIIFPINARDQQRELRNQSFPIRNSSFIISLLFHKTNSQYKFSSLWNSTCVFLPKITQNFSSLNKIHSLKIFTKISFSPPHVQNVRPNQEDVVDI